MGIDRRSARWAAAVGAVPVLSMAVVVSLLELLSSDLLSEAQRTTIADTALGPVLTAGAVLVYGVLLVVPAVTFSLSFPEDRDAGPVVGGFAVGAVVYGVGVAGVLALGGMGSPVDGHARFGTWLVLLFTAAAALGALGGDSVGPLFRAPEGADEENPRW